MSRLKDTFSPGPVLVAVMAGLFITAAASEAFIKDAFGAVLMRTIVSSRTGEEYALYIYIPENLRNIELRYPVVYLLDGDRHFAGLQQKIDRKIRDFRLPAMMIVGIGYGPGDDKRRRDYTPSPVKAYPGSGRVQSFYSFLRLELVPYIDNRFKTVAEPGGRCIAGHSYGGIAALYGLYNQQDLFAGFIAVSPALWWDNELFLRTRPEFSHLRSGTRLRVHLSSGALEARLMNSLSRRYYDVLRAHGHGKLIIRYTVLRGKNHDDVAGDGLEAGIHFMFK